MLEPGDKAPDFKLLGDDGEEHSLADWKGQELILYFYPKDNTPGCTQEACDFRDAAPKLKKRGAQVVGVSPDSIESHGRFKKKQGLDFLLLSDPEHEVAAKYGAWGDKVLYGRKFKGIIRSTFVIGKDGKIRAAEYKVSVKGHVDAIVASL